MTQANSALLNITESDVIQMKLHQALAVGSSVIRIIMVGTK